jgi:hypothetical protein
MVKVDFIGGEEEGYMITQNLDDYLIMSLEDVQSMIKQLKDLLKPVQFSSAIYPPPLDVEEYYKN